MKNSVVTALIDKIALLQDFIPERGVLVGRSVENILSSLRKQAAALRRYSAEEKAVAIQMGVDTVITEALISSPETQALLLKVGEAALDYYEHVDGIAKLSEATTIQ